MSYQTLNWKGKEIPTGSPHGIIHFPELLQIQPRMGHQKLFGWSEVTYRTYLVTGAAELLNFGVFHVSRPKRNP